MVIGMWQVVRTWHGWIWYLGNECLWMAYGLATHSHPIIAMSLIAGAVGVRNLKVARELSRTPNL